MLVGRLPARRPRGWSAPAQAAVGVTARGGVAGVVGSGPDARRWPPAGWSAAARRRSASLGARVLADGGTAVDAALAMAAMSWLALPGQCGIGGDVFAVVREPDGRVWTVNGSGYGPDGAYRGGLPATAGLSRGPARPGRWRSPPRGRSARWPPCTRRGGTREPRRALGARGGGRRAPVCPAPAKNRRDIAEHAARWPPTRTSPVAAAVPGGRPGGRRPALLRRSSPTASSCSPAEPQALYRGELAERAVALLRAGGAPFSGDEWAARRRRARRGARSARRYGDVVVHQTPPPSPGWMVLQQAGLLDGLLAGLPRRAPSRCTWLAARRPHALPRPLRALRLRQRRLARPARRRGLARARRRARCREPASAPGRRGRAATPPRPSLSTATAGRSASSTLSRSPSARGSPSPAPASRSTTGWPAVPT